MDAALAKLAEEDPTFRTYTDEETGQTIIAGMGELHLDIIIDRMKREFHVECNIGAPQVAFRETIRKAADCEGKFVRQSGGRGQYGHVWIKFEPNEEGKGFEFIDAVVGGSVPREYIKPTQEGLVAALNNGLVAGYPVVVSFRPTAAAISPASTSSISARWLACICTSLPNLSFLSFVAFNT